ncbi:alpha/beta hydrolase [Flagellimonas pacifica]|uniref:Predicted esterase n=1 Tax=Flagellimonas pacifica TaxID=1247520 RepID=A0A285MRE8_9FLAO|nr:esterase [Allomuricauda parva]SNY99744.1 Predicted esterase [Allomuricauda parva]
MESKEKTVTYTSKNTYATLNILSSQTKNVWLVFHGIGYLSKYFIKYFEVLNAEENYIIAPQAPSKYYLKNEYKYVGASWLTKENTITETKNVLHYIDAVLEAEEIPSNINLYLLGFSQGVSVTMRWMTQRKIKCHTLVLYAGGIPNELTSKDFDYLDLSFTQIKMVYGTLDGYLNIERLKSEKTKIDSLFGGKVEIITFEGGHEMKPEIIKNLI